MDTSRKCIGPKKPFVAILSHSGPVLGYNDCTMALIIIPTVRQRFDCLFLRRFMKTSLVWVSLLLKVLFLRWKTLINFQSFPKQVLGLWTTEICILYIGKKAGILASCNLYIGILLMEIGILVHCLSWNLYIDMLARWPLEHSLHRIKATMGVDYPW